MLSEPEPEGPGWTSSHISEALEMSERTIERSKKRLVEDGLNSALDRKPPNNSSRFI
jgi:predicted transcriptional regulator